MAKKQPGKSLQSAAKTLYAALTILKESGGSLPGRDVLEKIRHTVELSEYEKAQYEKTGNVRWESILHFYTIDAIKAGFMQKDKGYWIITPEGEEALKLGQEGLLSAAKKAYQLWQVTNSSATQPVESQEEPSLENVVEDTRQTQKALLQQYEGKAIEGIQQFINTKNPYEWQDIVATLLRGMGYHIAYNAKRGKDGGIDIIAYSDPLGTREPRIKVQVKHRPNDAVSIDVVKQLVANLNKSGDVGLFVTSGRFTSESERYGRESHIHLELIDFERFVDLWKKHYHLFTDEEKNMMPLQPIYFLGVNE
jgi:restriction system protein